MFAAAQGKRLCYRVCTYVISKFIRPLKFKYIHIPIERVRIIFEVERGTWHLIQGCGGGSPLPAYRYRAYIILGLGELDYC